MKYRIIEDGHGRFYVQRKYGFFSPWEEHIVRYYQYSYPFGFESFESASEKLNKQIDSEESAKLSEINSKKVVKSWSMDFIRKLKK